MTGYCILILERIKDCLSHLTIHDRIAGVALKATILAILDRTDKNNSFAVKVLKHSLDTHSEYFAKILGFCPTTVIYCLATNETTAVTNFGEFTNAS